MNKDSKELQSIISAVCGAGGKVTDAQGGDWKLESKMILATNGEVHSDVENILKTNKKFLSLIYDVLTKYIHFVV